MTSGYGSGGSKESVKSVIDGLETSPSKTQGTSPTYGTHRSGEGVEAAKGSVPAFKEKKGGSSKKS